MKKEVDESNKVEVREEDYHLDDLKFEGNTSLRQETDKLCDEKNDFKFRIWGIF